MVLGLLSDPLITGDASMAKGQTLGSCWFLGVAFLISVLFCLPAFPFSGSPFLLFLLLFFFVVL